MDASPLIFDKNLALRQIPLFSDLNFIERRIVGDAIDIVEAKRFHVVYREGDAPDAFYGILSGRVAITSGPEGKERSIEMLHRGKYFGFISLLTGDPHSVTAKAATDAILLKIPRERFQIILKHIPRIAIELSRMLSRRLKRLDIHPKSIFESTIIAVHSEIEIAEHASLYAVNLALGLHEQTRRRVVFVDAAGPSSRAAEALGLPPLPPVCLPEKLQKLDEIFSCITRHERGIDVLRVAPAADGSIDPARLLSFLTLLVNDYHYCLVHPPASMGLDVYKLLVQADSVHLLALPDPEAIKVFVKRMTDAGIGTDADFKKKTRLVVLEDQHVHGQGVRLFAHPPEALFYQPVYATLPRVPDSGKGLIDPGYVTPYAKVLRRISRQTGEILVGLALGSGSAMGIAHIGVLKALEKEGVDIDLASGSSIGALIGALWCAGYSAREVEEIILQSRSRKYLFGWDDLSFPMRGLLKGKHVRRFLEKYLEERTFRDLKRPFSVVACDAMTMKQVVFDSGRLVDAVMASISIPGVFAPYKIGSRYYFDGGILNPLPTNILAASGAKRIIAVNVLPSAEDLERTSDFLAQKLKSAARLPGALGKVQALWQRRILGFLKPNIFDTIVSSVQSMEYSLAHISGLSQADVVLHPDVVAVSWADFENIEDLVKRGEEETLLHLQEIRNLLAQSE